MLRDATTRRVRPDMNGSGQQPIMPDPGNVASEPTRFYCYPLFPRNLIGKEQRWGLKVEPDSLEEIQGKFNESELIFCLVS